MHFQSAKVKKLTIIFSHLHNFGEAKQNPEEYEMEKNIFLVLWV